MKKNYLIPEIYDVMVDGTNMIAQSINNAVGGSGTTVNYGGMGSADNGGIAARVKEQFTENYWQEEWSDE